MAGKGKVWLAFAACMLGTTFPTRLGSSPRCFNLRAVGSAAACLCSGGLSGRSCGLKGAAAAREGRLLAECCRPGAGECCEESVVFTRGGREEGIDHVTLRHTALRGGGSGEEEGESDEIMEEEVEQGEQKEKEQGGGESDEWEMLRRDVGRNADRILRESEEKARRHALHRWNFLPFENPNPNPMSRPTNVLSGEAVAVNSIVIIDHVATIYSPFDNQDAWDQYW